MSTSNADTLARLVWDYHQMHHRLDKADVILALGSHDLRVAARGAELYLDGLAPLVVMSGGLGNITRQMWEEPEAHKFAAIARSMGVPDEAILVEDRSTNTGDNIHFTRELLRDKALDPQRFILVQKPYMERRSYATFKKVWPEKDALVTSPQISFDDYPSDEIEKEKVINIMVGDLQRIRLYPARGFQIEQPIPAEVWAAFERLVELGFTANLIRD